MKHHYVNGYKMTYMIYRMWSVPNKSYFPTKLNVFLLCHMILQNPFTSLFSLLQKYSVLALFHWFFSHSNVYAQNSEAGETFPNLLVTCWTREQFPSYPPWLSEVWQMECHRPACLVGFFCPSGCWSNPELQQLTLLQGLGVLEAPAVLDLHL